MSETAERRRRGSLFTIWYKVYCTVCRSLRERRLVINGTRAHTDVLNVVTLGVAAVFTALAFEKVGAGSGSVLAPLLGAVTADQLALTGIVLLAAAVGVMLWRDTDPELPEGGG